MSEASAGTTRLANLETNPGVLGCRFTDEDRSVPNDLADKVLGDREIIKQFDSL